jgi:L-alanine-DL-glutamate epimerase-like enolase superfamily enzyme
VRHGLLVQLHTDAGVTGFGFGETSHGSRSLIAAVEEELAPLLVGSDARHHQQFAVTVRRSDSVTAQLAYGVVDIALWDLAAKASGLPLWRLLGGARDRARAMSAAAATAGLSADDVIALGRAALAAGMDGVRVTASGADPEADSRKILAIRDALGEECRFCVTLEQPYTYDVALPFGRFLEEEIGPDWFENAVPASDASGLSRLASRLDTPLAIGSRLQRAEEFARLVELGVAGTFRPDPARLGITGTLQVIALCDLTHRPVVPVALPEISVHLACGVGAVNSLEVVDTFRPLFRDRLSAANGIVAPPAGPGLGVELLPDAVERYRMR